MSIHVMSFIEMASMSMLAILDNDSADVERLDNGRYYIVNNGKFRSMLRFYLRSFCRNNRQFGTRMVVINSCSPCNNWRKEERGSPICAGRYQLSDPDCFVMDRNRLEATMEGAWKALQEDNPDAAYLHSPSVDFCDTVAVMSDFIRVGMVVHPCRFYFLRDGNLDYTHFEKVCAATGNEIETALRERNLIL